MIAGAITVLRPTAPGVAPGTALPAGPQGAPGPTGAQGFQGGVGSQGATGPVGATGPAATQAQVSAAVSALAIGTTAGTIAAGNDARIVGAAPLASPALTGTPTATTAAANDDSIRIATTAYVDNAVSVERARAQGTESLLAPLASPAFTGTPTIAVPPAFSDNSYTLSPTSWTKGQFMATVGRSLLDFYLPTDADLSAAFNRAIAAAPSTGPTCIRLPPSKMQVGAAQVVINKPIQFVGIGQTDSPTIGATVIACGTASGPAITTSPFLITTGADGTRFVGCEIQEANHAAPAAGWAPTVNAPFFNVSHVTGAVQFEDVLFRGVYQGVNALWSGRLGLFRVRSHCFYCLSQADAAFDSDRYDDLHLWEYWSQDPNVSTWTYTNGWGIRLLNCDTPFVDRLFAITLRGALYLGSGTSSGSGDTQLSSTRGKAGSIVADFCQFGLYVDSNASLADFQVANLDCASPAPTTSAKVAGTAAIMVLASGVRVRVGILLSNATDYVAAIKASGSAIDIGFAEIDNWGYVTANTAAFDTSAAPGSTICLGSSPRTYFWTSRVLKNGTGISLGPSAANLIINGDFRINQRAYVSGAAITNGTYTFDRWLWAAGTGASCTYTTASDGTTTVTIPAAGAFQQRILPSSIAGGDYTLSLLGTAQGRIDYTPPGGSTVNGTQGLCPITVPSIPAGSAVTIWVLAGSSSATVTQVKLEVGDKPTPFAPQTTAEALRACQPYYEVSGRTYTCSTSEDVRFTIPKNTTPTVTITAVSGGTVTVSLISTTGFLASSSSSGTYTWAVVSEL